MTRYRSEVKLYVLEQRNKRNKPKWKALQEEIRKRFGIEPPTIRMMQKWENELDLNNLNAEFAKDMKRQMPDIQANAEINFANSLLPTIMNARKTGEDMEMTGWKWFLQFMEKQVGAEKFERIVHEYMESRQV